MQRIGKTLVTRDRVKISVAVYRAGAAPAPRLLIICPGFFKSKETPTFDRLSRRLAGRRDVLTMDFRGHGRSGGRFTFTASESQDLEVVLRWCQRRYAWIDLMGFSLGGAIAINTAALFPGRVRRLVAVSAPATFERIEMKFWTPEAIRNGLAGLERGAGCRPGAPWLPKTAPVDSVRRLAGMPLLFVHGTRDVIVGVQHSRRLFEAAAEPKTLEVVKDGSHAEAMFRDAPEAFAGLVDGWLQAD